MGHRKAYPRTWKKVGGYLQGGHPPVQNPPCLRRGRGLALPLASQTFSPYPRCFFSRSRPQLTLPECDSCAGCRVTCADTGTGRTSVSAVRRGGHAARRGDPSSSAFAPSHAVAAGIVQVTAGVSGHCITQKLRIVSLLERYLPLRAPSCTAESGGRRKADPQPRL